MAGEPSRVALGPGVAALGAVIVKVVLDDVVDGADVGVCQLREILVDVVVEVDLDVCVLGLVGEATRGAVVPVPAVGGDDGLVVGDLGVVDDGCAGALDELDEGGERGLLLGVRVHPEALPGDAKGGVLEGLLGGEELGVATFGGLPLLRGRVVVSRVDAVDGVECVDCVADGAAKCAD